MPEARDSADTRLRDYLLGEAVDFRQLMSSTLGDLQTTEGKTAWELFTPKVDALMDDREVRVRRDDLPQWHPESTAYGGRPDDEFVLGCDDVLRAYVKPPPDPSTNGHGQVL